MTVDDHDVAGFQGLMRSLNLDSSEFKQYDPSSFPTYSFEQLSNLKLEIESQLRILFNLLEQKYGANMETRLVSSDGFPRSDIDVVSIRLIRVQIIRLKNDYKELLKVLDSKVAEEFSRRQSEVGDEQVQTESRQPQQQQKRSQQQANPTIPFAQVKEVVSGGPAESAGLHEGDLIIVFDNDIHALNHDKLSKLVERVRAKPGEKLSVSIKRGDKILDLTLDTNATWDGKGIGCRIVPV
ncbi:NAS2 [Candida theae]|uniref:Probable 26S proteasome regulatory subunit p27 n=1 Tax=Candida theae TaxID=1198502 RepID=A0AAD5BFB7_9ASCO|nr:NAS2 [Candida theae]KAI5958119.1 NAS2 [Candida theae]